MSRIREAEQETLAASETGSAPVPGFGLIIIGTEILDGRREDKHLANAMRLLRERRLDVRYAFFLVDDPELIRTQLSWAMQREEPFFCFGGIGSTPDDYTRGCAAEAAGVPLAMHPEGVAILRSRFGKEATAPRLRMVEFPRGCSLVPNPVNQVPGFRVRNGYFLPGFPEMAEPMMRWVLDTHFERGAQRVVRTLVLRGAREADLVDLMEDFMASHPAVSFSSLPMFTGRGTEVHLGFKGAAQAVGEGIEHMAAALARAGVGFEEAP